MQFIRKTFGRKISPVKKQDNNENEFQDNNEMLLSENNLRKSSYNRLEEEKQFIRRNSSGSQNKALSGSRNDS